MQMNAAVAEEPGATHQLLCSRIPHCMLRKSEPRHMEHCTLRSAISQVRRARAPRPMLSALLTLGSALLAIGGGFGAAALLENFITPHTGRFFGLRDEEAILCVTVAALAWVVFLIWLLTPMAASAVRKGIGWSFVLRIGGMLLIGAIAALSVLVIDWLPVRGDEFAATAVILLAAGAALLIWLPAAWQFDKRFLAISAAGKVDVRCPNCDYSLQGLRETRCPECGSSYTIDELVERQ